MENMKDMNETMVNELNPEMLEKVAGGKKKSKKTETGEARRQGVQVCYTPEEDPEKKKARETAEAIARATRDFDEICKKDDVQIRLPEMPGL